MKQDAPTAIIVDDEEHIRQIVRRLMSLRGVEVAAEMSSGADAVAWMNANEADIVIMDIQMPGMNGIEATREIKRLTPAVTVFGFTGWGSADAEEMLAAGASAVFEKTKLQDLLDAISTSLGLGGDGSASGRPA